MPTTPRGRAVPRCAPAGFPPRRTPLRGTPPRRTPPTGRSPAAVVVPGGIGAGYAAWPPSTANSAPVTYAASGPARKDTIAATSAGVPKRPRAVSADCGAA